MKNYSTGEIGYTMTYITQLLNVLHTFHPLPLPQGAIIIEIILIITITVPNIQVRHMLQHLFHESLPLTPLHLHPHPLLSQDPDT